MIHNKRVKTIIIGTACAIIGIVGFVSIIALDFLSGEVVYKYNIDTFIPLEKHTFGPIYLDKSNKYGIYVKVNFIGRLDSNCVIDISSKDNSTIWSQRSSILGISDKNIGSSTIGFPSIGFKRTGDYFISSQLETGKYKCDIHNVTIIVKKGVVHIPDTIFINAPILALIGLCLIFIAIHRK
jgi:hypothetical protein